MLFKDFEKRFFFKKLFVFLSYFFFLTAQKGPIENETLKIPASAIFRDVKGSRELWHNKVARPGCLDAILVGFFFKKKTTTFESRHAEAIVMSIQPY